MRHTWLFATVLTTCATFSACTAVRTVPDPDIAETVLPTSVDDVKTALIQVLASGGYDIDEDSGDTLATGPRQETRGPWDWLLRWRFGVIKSRVEARMIPLEPDFTRLRLQVFPRSKDGIFDAWRDEESPLPQSAANQIRLLKNALQIL
jgi:hypothetical protein